MRKKKKMKNPRKRFITGVSVGILFAMMVAFIAVPVHQAQAFPGEALAAAVWKEVRDQVRYIADKASQAAKEAYKTTKDVAFKNALRIYLTKIAEDTATYIATGGAGQKPLFLTNPGKYFVDVGDAALGDYLDTISSGALGTSLCDIGPVHVKIDLALRAEINPNFCTNGCQRSYEQKLSAYGIYDDLIAYLTGVYKEYYNTQGQDLEKKCSDQTPNGKAACENVTPQGTCSWDQGASLCNANVDRPMTPGEMRGGMAMTKLPVKYLQDPKTIPLYNDFLGASTLGDAYQKIIEARCPIEKQNTTTGEKTIYLKSCLDALTSTITAEKQNAQFDQQRCVRLCTGEKRTAKCTFSQIKQRTTTAFKQSDFNKTYPQIFDAKQNEVGQYLFAYETSREQAATETQKAKDAITFDKIGSVKSPVSGSITSPSTLTQAAATKSVNEAGKDITTYTGSPLADAIGVFTNTLTKKLIERIFNPALGGYANSGASQTLLGGGFNFGGIAAARAQFAKAFTPNLTRQNNTEVDVLSALQGDNALDGDMAEAARQELTVEEAIDAGLLHGDWWFGYSDKGSAGQKTEPTLGNGGYPASVFPILRTNRIIPVGWEIAAEYINQYDTGSYTLNDIIAAFDDDTSPFYQLVDPKWVLKAPLSVCAKQGYSGKLVDGSCQSSDVVETGNDDVDPCILGEHDTNGDGKCNQDDPPIYENTCERKQVCVDQQTCIQETPDGTGCEQYGYCTKELPIWRFQGEQCDAQYASCQAYTDSNSNQVSYLKDTVDSKNCSADNVGCRRYCYRDLASGQYTCQYNPSTGNYTGDQIFFDNSVQSCAASDAGCTQFLRMTDGANILPNGSFELYTTPYPVSTQANFSGWTVGDSGQTCGAQSFVDTLASSGSTAMRLQQLSACAGNPHQYAQQTVDTGQLLDNTSYTFSFNALALNAPCQGSVTIGNDTFTPTFTENYQRFVASTVFPAGTGTSSFLVRINSIDSCPLIIDDAKIEKGNSATAYSNYGDSAIYMKDAPPTLTCTGNPQIDPGECASYASQCTEGDVGCKAWTPTNGGITIPGKATDPSACDPTDPTSCDQCPSAFLGCRAYQEIPLTNKVPDPTLAGRTSAPGNEYVSIVAEQGRQCTAQYVGCEEYTNLDIASQGGEAREYYSQVRQCVTPSDPDAAYYFSWVGSASQGFELKRWHLKKSTNPGSPDSDAPCTNLVVGADPNAACEDTAANVNNCSADFPNDPSCVQFYDEGGGVHYRNIDDVIFVTDSCAAYRNTLDAQTYFFDPTASTTCPSTFAGCREYKGASTNNSKTLFTSTFEQSGDPSDGWSLIPGSVEVTTEALTFPGHSLWIDSNQTSQRDVTGEQGKAYVLTFWARSADAVNNAQIIAALEGAPQEKYFTWDEANATSNLTVTPEWKQYSLGPVTIDTSFNVTNPSYIQLQTTSGQIYIDNIQLVESTQDVFVVKSSAPSCSGYENCTQYKDAQGNTQDLKGFTKLCSQNVLGCEALIDTHNSSTPFQTDLQPEQKYLQTNRSSYSSNVPTDSVRFLVNDPKKYCSANAKGCQELALPSINQDLSVSNYQTVYLKSDPDTFTTTLCSENAVGCQAFTQLEDGTSIDYFKDPQTRVCEYRENVGASKQTGWFQKGNDTPCDATWVRSCPQEQSTCREFYAPRIYKNPATPDSQSYYYLDSSLTKNACPQGVDPRNSCLGFQDTSQTINTIRPKIDPDNSGNVLTQSCQACSTDNTSCGRNGNSPCCSWNPSNCSIDKATGSDDQAPYYCVYQQASADFDNCTATITDSYVVPNSGDVTTATNCGQAGQPNCFKPDLSDYDSTERYCGDFACDANVVLPVKPDRICDQWLECTNEQKVIRDGKETTVCLERTLRDRNGYIPDDEGDNKKANLEKSSPADIKDLANYSGLTKAGMIRNSATGSLIVEGLFPYSQFTEDGLDGAFIAIPNNDFEDDKIAVSESPMPISSTKLTARGWIDAETFPWRVTKAQDGTETARIQLEKSNTSDNFSNQYLAVISGNTDENGVRVNIENPDELSDNAKYYQLSFRAKAQNVIQQGIRMNIYQDGTGELFSDGSSVGLQLTTQWKDYVVRLYNNPGNSINPAKQSIELRFLFRKGSVPSDTFYIDDVQLKPVLQIREGISRQPVSGLSASYFQAKLQPANGSLSGLNGEHWDNMNWDFVANGGAPAIPPDLTQQEDSIDFPYNTVGTPSAENDAYTWRFTGGILIDDSSTNRFYFNHDDGARLYIEDMNNPILDKWGNAACMGSDVSLQGMSEGWHPVKIEWYNKPDIGGLKGYGGLQFGWHPGPGGLAYLPGDNSEGEFPATVCTTQACGGGVYANICKNDTGGDIVPSTHLVTALEIDKDNLFSTGKLMKSTMDSTIDFANFNDRLKEVAGRGDAVGVLWAGEVYAPATGSYTFYLKHKDGVKFYLDNEFTPVAEDWNIGPERTTQYTTTLEEGYHTIKIAFFKDLDVGQDVAVMQFGWNKDVGGAAMGAGQWIIPEDYLRSYPSSPTGFVARQCRSYPQSDSSVCDYEDSQTGVQYKGWKGYCVEKDPRDPTVCLNWWPIDVLAGETNVFADQSLSLTRAPLFYCAEADSFDLGASFNGSPATVFDNRFVLDDAGVKAQSLANNCPNLVFDGKNSSYKKLYGKPINSVRPMFTQISSNNFPAKNLEDAVTSSGTEACQMGTTLFNLNRNTIWSDVFDPDGDGSLDISGIFGLCDATNGNGCAIHEDKKGYSMTVNADPQDQYHKSDIRYVNFVLNRWSHDDWDDNVTVTEDGPTIFTLGENSTCLSGGNCWTGTYDSNGDTVDGNKITISLFFDSNDILKQYSVYSYDDNNGGGFWVQGIFHMKSICRTLVQVTKANGKSVPWTARIQSGKIGTTGDEQSQKYQLGTACAPYGATPVIDRPSDIVLCKMNADATDAQKQAGCGVGCSADYCSFVPSPLQLYTPGNSQYKGTTNICTQTVLGGGFYSCGGGGTCQSCVGGPTPGLGCFSDSDCGDGGTCEHTFGTGETATTPGTIIAPEPTTLPTQTPYSGIARLKQLFAKSYGMWNWSDSLGKYVREEDQPNWAPPVDDGVFVSNGGGVCLDETYHTSDPNVFCGIRPTVSGIKINGQDSGDVVLSSGAHAANLEFSYKIDPEQTPIKSISIDWGDSDPLSVYNSSSATKIYGCKSKSDNGKNCTACYGGITPSDIGGGTMGCVYDQYPKIQVKDNWGWCNIRSTSSASGCSAGSEDWDYFDGRIIVTP